MEAIQNFVTVISGLAWSYCSDSCMRRCVRQMAEGMSKEIAHCPHCSALNAELLAQLTGRQTATTCPAPARPATLDVTENRSYQSHNASVCCRPSKPGKITKNNFFNYLRERRLQECGKNPRQLVHDASIDWGQMNEQQKQQYTKSNVRKHSVYKCK